MGCTQPTNYIRFYIPVKTNENDIFTVRIVAENNNKNDLFNIKVGNVYDVIIDKKMSAHSTIKNNSSSSLIEQTSNNSIPQNQKNVTPEQITIEVCRLGATQQIVHGTVSKSWIIGNLKTLNFAFETSFQSLHRFFGTDGLTSLRPSQNPQVCRLGATQRITKLA